MPFLCSQKQEGLTLRAEPYRLGKEMCSLSLQLARWLTGPWSSGVCSRLWLRDLGLFGPVADWLEAAGVDRGRTQLNVLFGSC